MNIDLTKIKEQMAKSLKRFPVCLVLLAALTLQLIGYIIAEKNPDAWSFFFCVGMLVALLLHLLTEDNPELQCSQIKDNAKVALIWCIPFILLGIDSYALHIGDENQATYIAQTAAILALLIGICFLPFRKEKDDRMSWNFVLRLITGACIAFLVGLVMFSGLSLLYYGSSELFGFKSEGKVYEILAVLCFVTLTTLLFLIRIPEGEDMHCTNAPRSKFILGTTRYLFIPLVMLYMLVLYVYGVKILFTWTLPKGMLSWLVSTLMFGIIGITFLLYPYLRDENHKGYEVRLIRLLPLLVLPLLVLMSVGIGRRFIDYGITDKRLYVLTLNIWFYIVAFGLWFIKARRIHWVSISFAALLVLTSCHPGNFSNIYKNLLLERFNTIADKYKIKCKFLNERTLTRELYTMSDKDARQFFETIKDIRNFDYRLFCKDLGLDSTMYIYESYEDFMGIKKGERRRVKPYSMEYIYDKDEIAIPHKYKYLEKVFIYAQTLHTDSNSNCRDSKHWGIMCNDSTFIFCSQKFGKTVVPYRKLDNSRLMTLDFPNHDAELVIEQLRIEDDEPNHSNMDFKMEGYIFYNK